MNTTDRAVETDYLFMIMGNLAAAKSASNLVGIADCISDLEMIARHSEAAFLAKRAAKEAQAASEVLADLRTRRVAYGGSKAGAITAATAANLN